MLTSAFLFSRSCGCECDNPVGAEDCGDCSPGDHCKLAGALSSLARQPFRQDPCALMVFDLLLDDPGNLKTPGERGVLQPSGFRLRVAGCRV